MNSVGINRYIYERFIMRRVQISGKPSNFVELVDEAGNVTSATFTLTERYYSKGTNYDVRWIVNVQPFNVKFVKKMCEKGYSVIVHAAEFEVLSVPTFTGDFHGWLSLSELVVP